MDLLQAKNNFKNILKISFFTFSEPKLFFTVNSCIELEFGPLILQKYEDIKLEKMNKKTN